MKTKDKDTRRETLVETGIRRIAALKEVLACADSTPEQKIRAQAKLDVFRNAAVKKLNGEK